MPKEPEWQAVWDESAAEHYYWNPKTQETTWNKPESMKDIELPIPVAKAKEALSEAQVKQQEYYSSKEYYEWYTRQAQEQQIQQSIAQTSASFAQAQKGNNRFSDLQTASTLHDSASHASTREYKQMSYFFDVEKYQEERALDRMKPKVVKKYTKGQVDQFKKKKHEKKVASLLMRMGKIFSLRLGPDA